MIMGLRRHRNCRIRTAVFIIMAACACSILAAAGAMPEIVPAQEGDSADSSIPAESNEESTPEPQTTDLTVKVIADINGTEIPLKDAKVSIVSSGENIATKTTDASGKAFFASLPRAKVTVKVNVPDVATHTASVNLTKESQAAAITVPWPLGQLSISVSGMDGTLAPIPDCHVSITARDGLTHRLQGTDANGVVTAKNLPLGKMTITAIATGWETKMLTYQLAEDDGDLRIELTRQSPP